MDKEFLNNYWKYYLILEEDFLGTLRYVELHSGNFNTFSTEYTKQYQAICSEIDVVCKEFCKVINSTAKVGNIESYAKIILNEVSKIRDEKITIKKYRVNALYPWREWRLECGDVKYKSPEWWTKYNKVKHNRNQNFEQANLGNVLSALAALFVLEVYCYEKIKNGVAPIYPKPRSNLFILEEFHDGIMQKRTINELSFIE